MSNNNCCILVATHKPYDFPSDNGLFPIHVGAGNSSQQIDGIQRDDEGDSISELNPYFCELTGLYWAWKNTNYNYYGLVHYRRYFQGISGCLDKKQIASSRELLSYLKDFDIVVAKKRNYYIESVESHYKNAHHIYDLELTREILGSIYPNYLKAFDVVMKGRSLSLFNMFLTNKTNFEGYMEWLFKILFELEKVIPYKAYNDYQKRVFGFLAERLFNVWLEHNRSSLKIKYIKVINIEGENIFAKAIGLIRRKFKST